MITFNYTDRKGKLKQGNFFEDWSEVPFLKFVKWQELIPEIASVESEIKSKLANIDEIKAKYERFFFEGKMDAEKAKKAQEQFELSQKIIAQIEDIRQNELYVLEVKGIALFCDIDTADLLSFSYNNTHSAATQNINYYKHLLFELSKKPLPTKAAEGVIVWQSLTDKELEQLENKYNSIPFFSKMTSAARELKAKIEQGRQREYKIENIWNHSTYANYQFRQAAKAIVEDMNTGKSWSSLPTLICMLLVEKNTHSEVLNRISVGLDAQQYLEHYAAEYKKVFDKNYELFFCQKKQMSVYDVVTIRNFFLHSHKKFQKPILKS